MTVIAGAALPAYITNNTEWDIQAGAALPVYITNDIVIDGSTIGALLVSNNLSDLSNVATARTNLGLIAGGTGDIWVEKAGDTMTGALLINVPTATVTGLTLKSTDDSAILPLLNLVKADGVTSVVKAKTTISGNSATDNFLLVTGTYPSTRSIGISGANFVFTSNGSDTIGSTYQGVAITLNVGYTGGDNVVGLNVLNTVAGTNVASVVSGNTGVRGQVANTTTGNNAGLIGIATGSSTLNAGVVGASTANSVGVNVGFIGRVLNSTGIQIGGFFGLLATPTFFSGAVVADNGATSEDIIGGYDNSVLVFRVANGGVVSTKQGGSTAFAKIGGSIFGSFADVSVGGAETDIFTDTLVASSLGTNGDIVFAEYGGNFVTVGTELTQLKIYFDGQSIWDSAGLAPASGTTSWRVVVEIIRVSSTVIRYTVSLNTTGASGYTYCTVGELTGRTLSNTNILKLTGTSSGVGSGAGDIVGKMHYVRWWPAA